MGYFGDAGNISPHASPIVRYTDLELDSDLTLGNGDNKVKVTVNLCLGFSDEIGLSRRGSYAGLDTTIASAGAGGSEKVESVVSASERSQSFQPRKNVPSGLQQTTDVVLPSQYPK